MSRDTGCRDKTNALYAQLVGIVGILAVEASMNQTKLDRDTKMPAYVIAEIEITDPVAYEEYRRQVNEVNAKFGGRFIVRGGRIESVEGDWSPKRLAIVEFPSMEQALKWYKSDDLAPLIALRQKAARSKFIIVEGV